MGHPVQSGNLLVNCANDDPTQAKGWLAWGTQSEMEIY